MGFFRTVLRVVKMILVIGLIWPTASVSARMVEQGGPTPLDQAVQSGQLFITGEPVAMGFSQPMINLELTSTTGNELQVSIQSGTLLKPADPAFSPLILAETTIATVSTKTSLQLTAFSLDPDLRFPDAMHETEYGYAGMADAGLTGLLDKINASGYTRAYGAQLAIWATSKSMEIGEVVKGLKNPPGQKDIELGECILGGADCQVPEVPVPGQTMEPGQITRVTPGNPNEIEKPRQSGSGLWIGIAVVLILGMGAGIILLSRRKSEDGSQVDGSLGGLGGVSSPQGTAQRPVEKPVGEKSNWGLGGMPIPVPIPEPKPKTPVTPPEPLVKPAVTRRARLECIAGPFTGQIFTCELPFILSRNPLEIVVVRENTISGPHAVLDLSEEPPSVKDLNSSNGIVIAGTRQGSGWINLEPGQTAFMGKAELTFSGHAFRILSGSAAGAEFGPFTDPVVLSKDALNVLSLGDQDRQISDAHVMFSISENQVQIRDLNSTRGTLVNGIAPNRDQILQPGDRIRLGASEFIFQPEPG